MERERERALRGLRALGQGDRGSSRRGEEDTLGLRSEGALHRCHCDRSGGLPARDRVRRGGDVQQAVGCVRAAEALREIDPALSERQHGPLGSLVKQARDRLQPAARGVLAADEHEHHRGVAWRGLPGQDRAERRLVDRLAREVDRADERYVDLVGLEHGSSGPQGRDARGLLHREGEAGASEVELRGDAVGRDVRHGAHHTRRAQHGHERLARAREPVGIGARVAHGQAPAGAVAADLGVGLGAEQHGGPLARQIGHGAGGLHRRVEQHQLLSRGLGEIVRREAQLLERQRDVARAALRGALPPRLRELEAASAARAHRGRHDRDLAPVARSAADAGLETGDVLLDDEVRVVPPESERADRREPGLAGLSRPGLGPREQAEGAWRLEQRQRRVDVQGRRPQVVLHRREHLDEAGGARGGDEVAEVALERADGRVDDPVPEGGHQRLELGAVADGGARRVALDERQPTRVDAASLGLRPGDLQRPDLALGGRREQAPAPPVVGQAHPADHPVDLAPALRCVLQPHQGDKRGPLCGHEPVCLAVEGARAAALAHGVERAEAHVDEQVVRAAHRAREAEIDLAALQLVAAELDGVERGGAGRVERERPAQAELLGEKQRRQAAHEAVARVDGGEPSGPLHPDPLGVAAHRRGREAEVAEDRLDVARAVTVVAGLPQRGAARGQDPVEQGIEREQVRLRAREGIAGELGGEVEARHVAAAVRPAPVRRSRGIGGQRERRRQIPAAVGRTGEQIPARRDGLPQGLWRMSAGQDAAPADDRDGLEHGALRPRIGAPPIGAPTY